MHVIRKLAVNLLYDVANAICVVADWLSPSTDEIWRGRAWKQWDAERAATPEELHTLDGVKHRFSGGKLNVVTPEEYIESKAYRDDGLIPAREPPRDIRFSEKSEDEKQAMLDREEDERC